MQHRIIFPGAGYLEMARAGARGAVSATAAGVALQSVFFLQPLAVEVAGLQIEVAVADGRLEVRSGAPPAAGAALDDLQVHCAATLAAHDGWQRVEQASVRAEACTRAAGVDALYDGFDFVGLQYGPRFRTLVHAWGGGVRATAQLRARATHEGTAVHPADLDDALCVGAVASSGEGGGGTRLPFAVDEARLQGGGGAAWAVRGLVAM